jgi:hypothetical protein
MARAVQVRIGKKPFEIITAWAGSIATIPMGWRFCNGLNNTPDARDYFIKNYYPGFSGGSDTSIYSHNHGASAVTDNETGHTHTESGRTGMTASGDGAMGGGPATIPTVGLHNHTPYSLTSDPTTHHHTLIGDSAVTDVGGDVRPPFYALAYIKGSPPTIPVGMIFLYDGLLFPFARSVFGTAGPATTLASPWTVGDTEMFVTSDLGLAPPFIVFIESDLFYVYAMASGTHYTGVGGGFYGTTATNHAAGAVVQQPKYVPCLGANGTPNVPGLVVGAGDLYPVGVSGGADSISVDPHTHGPGSLAGDVATHPHFGVNISTDPPTPNIQVTQMIAAGLAGQDLASNHQHGYDTAIDADPTSSHGHSISAVTVLANDLGGSIVTQPRFIGLWSFKRVA